MTLDPLQPATATVASSASASSAGSGLALTSVQLVITDVAEALQDLSRPIQTGATALSLSPDGHSLTLATALGNVTVSLGQQLNAGEKQNLLQQLTTLLQTQRPLTLTLQPGSPPTQGALLIPTNTATATPQLAVPGVQIAAPSSSILPVQALTVGEDLPAIVLATLPSPPTASPEIPNPLPASVLPSATALAPEIPATPQTINDFSPARSAPVFQPIPGTTANTPTPPAAFTPQPITYLPIQTLPSAPVLQQTIPPEPQIADILQPGTEVTLHIDAVLPPNSPASPLPLAPNQIRTTVSGAGTDGQLILNAGDTSLFVKAQVAAPVGTTIVVTVAAAKPAPFVTLPPSDLPAFQSLPQAVAALAQMDPQVLQQVLASRLPQPTEALPGALLFLFSAFKQGNVRGWLGDTATDSLWRNGKSDIVNSLARDLNEAGQPAQDAVVGEWRSYPIPLYAQQQFQALTLYVHNDRDARQNQQGDAKPVGKIRFLIDMRLSKLGAMQVDGFVQPKKLDMILRSETLLPEGLHQSLRLAYIKAIEAVGYTGALNFQVGRQHWMRMQKEAAQGVVT